MKSLKKIVFILFILIFTELFFRIIGTIYLSNLFIQSSSSKNRNILVLGESSTAGLWVKQNESYPAQLEKILRRKEDNIRVIVPMHMGQNTAQMANRIDDYIKWHNPKLIVIMAGYNNEWSLAENHLQISGFEGFKIKLLSFMDNFRFYRILRYVFLKFANYSGSLSEYLIGGPEYVRYPPSKAVYLFAIDHKNEFIDAWRFDIRTIIYAAKKNKIPVVLMTYHINPTYLSAEEFEKMADEEGIALIRNDLLFKNLSSEGKLTDYVFAADNWHPNAKGYEIIAGNLADKIEQLKLLD